MAVKPSGATEAPLVRESIQLFNSGAAEQYMGAIRSACVTNLGWTDDYFVQHGDHSIYMAHSSPTGTARMLLIRRSDVLLKLSVFLANESGDAHHFYDIVTQADRQFVDAMRTLGVRANAEATPTSAPSTTTDKLLSALLAPADLGAGWTTQDQTTRNDAQRALTEPCQKDQATAFRAAGAFLEGEKYSGTAQRRPEWHEIIAVLAPEDMTFYLQQLADACRATPTFAERPAPSLGDESLHFSRASSSCCSPLRELVVVRLGAALLQVQYDEGDVTAMNDTRFESLLKSAYDRFKSTIEQLPGSELPSARRGQGGLTGTMDPSRAPNS